MTRLKNKALRHGKAAAKAMHRGRSVAQAPRVKRGLRQERNGGSSKAASRGF